MVKTNYELCKDMNAFIEKQLPDQQERRRVRTKYFALYTFLLHKVFQFKMEFCKELISIFCSSFVSYAKSTVTPVQIFSDITNTIVVLDRAYCAGLKQKASGETERTQNAFRAVSDKMLELTKTPETPANQKLVMDHIVIFLEHISSVVRLMQRNAPAEGPRDALAAENMRASRSNPEETK